MSNYLAENYRDLHRIDDSVLVHHSAVYRTLAPGSLARTVEIGVGPNLYPLFLASGAARRIDAIDRSAAGLDYLRSQLTARPDQSWDPYWRRCRELNPGLPATGERAPGKVRPVRGDAFTLTGRGYDLASMNFVAESVTEDVAEFERFCAAFAATVRSGGLLVAAFMENMSRYQLGDGSWWPGTPVDVAAVSRAFARLTTEFQVSRIDADPELPDYGYTGMVLLRARRPRGGPAVDTCGGSRRPRGGRRCALATLWHPLFATTRPSPSSCRSGPRSGPGPEEVEYLHEEEEQANMAGWKDLKIPWIRRLFIAGIGVAIAQQCTGINSIMYYRTRSCARPH